MTENFEQALKELRAKTNGPQPHSLQGAATPQPPPMWPEPHEGQRDDAPRMQQKRPQREHEVSIVESVSEFTRYIASFLEEAAEEEIAAAAQKAEHYRALAARVRQTGIGG